MKRRLWLYGGVALVGSAAVLLLSVYSYYAYRQATPLRMEVSWLRSKPCLELDTSDAIPLGGHFFNLNGHIYWGCEPITDADATTFRLYLPEFGVENGLGPDSFAFSHDNQHVFESDVAGVQTIEGADPATFVVLGTSWGGVSIYEKDAHRVYWYSQVVLGSGLID